MVKTEYLLKAINSYLEKCTVTLKAIRNSISLTVEAITDTQEEYDTLMDTISHYFRDSYNKTEETCLLEDYNGNRYINTDGDEMSVEVPDDAINEGKDNGLLYGIHNHPVSVSLMSGGDYAIMINTNQKYSIVVANDDITIAKNFSGETVGGVDGGAVMLIDAMHTYKNIEEIKKTPSFKQLVNDYKEGKVTDQEKEDLLQKELVTYFKENYDSEIDDLNNDFDAFGVPLRLYGVKITNKR